MCVKVKVYIYAVVRVVAIHNTTNIFWRHSVYRKAKQTGHTNVNHWENKTLTTNFSPISKKTTSAIFSQPIEQDAALRPFCYVL